MSEQTGCNRPNRLDTYQKVFLKIATPRNPNRKSGCLKAVTNFLNIWPGSQIQSFATGAMQQNWNKMFAFGFPRFSLMSQVINKLLGESVKTMILVRTHMAEKTPALLRIFIQRPLLLPVLPNLLLNPQGEKHPIPL